MPANSYEYTHNPFNILIIGGGIAGIMLALLLERQGHRITLIEQSKEWKPVGGGITLTLNGVKLLNELGISDITAHANIIRHIHITNQKGRQLSAFHPEEYAAYANTVTIMRHSLHTLITSRLQNTNIQLGTSYTSIENSNNNVTVALTDGSTAQYDLVAACDGINSLVRDNYFTGVQYRYSGYASWRFVVGNVAGLAADTITEMWGRGKRFGIVPLPGNKIHCFASINTPQNTEANRHITIAAFKTLFAEFGTTATQLISAIPTPVDLMYNDLEDIYVPKWHNRRLVLVGDAAHGMTPNITQGASMAIEDACVLAKTLAAGTTLEHSLATFDAARRRRVTAIQKKSWLLGRLGQVDTSLLCNLRNYCWKTIPDRWIQTDLKNLLINQVMHV